MRAWMAMVLVGAFLGGCDANSLCEISCSRQRDSCREDCDETCESSDGPCAAQCDSRCEETYQGCVIACNAPPPADTQGVPATK